MKLKCNLNGSTDTINLVDSPPSLHRIAIRHNNRTFYAKRGETNHPQAANNLRIMRNGKTLAAIKNYNPVNFDECGQPWSIVGNPSVGDNGLNIADMADGLWRPFSNFYISDDFTVEFKFKLNLPDDITSGVLTLARTVLSSAGVSVSYSVPSRRFKFYVTNPLKDVLDKKTAPPSGETLFHVAECFSVSDATWHFFIDGIHVGDLPTNYSNPTLDFLSLGNYNRASNSPAFYGSIDEFRFSSGICRYTENFTPQNRPFEVDEFTYSLLHF